MDNIHKISQQYGYGRITAKEYIITVITIAMKNMDSIEFNRWFADNLFNSFIRPPTGDGE